MNRIPKDDLVTAQKVVMGTSLRKCTFFNPIWPPGESKNSEILSHIYSAPSAIFQMTKGHGHRFGRNF
jgi:hypothetical protein